MNYEIMNYDYVALKISSDIRCIFSDIKNAYFLATNINEKTFRFLDFNNYIKEQYGVRLLYDFDFAGSDHRYRGSRINIEDLIIEDEQKYLMFLLKK
jgi:hypothetical protein